jgi:hypothetical protein
MAFKYLNIAMSCSTQMQQLFLVFPKGFSNLLLAIDEWVHI